MATTKETTKPAYGPYKTTLTLMSALALMSLPVVVVIGEHRWILADADKKHIDALCRLWAFASREKRKHLWAYIDPIPLETFEHIVYERATERANERRQEAAE